MKTCSAVNKLFRREFWEKTASAFPAGRYYEDLAAIPKALALAGRIIYRKEVLYYYLNRQGSIMHSSDFSRNYADRTAAVESVEAFFREHGLADRYRDELEYLVFENAFFVPSKEIVLNDRRSAYLEKFRSYAYGKYPRLDQNRYVREMSGKDRMLWMLLKRKWYGVMVLLSYARRVKDRITGR